MPLQSENTGNTWRDAEASEEEGITLKRLIIISVILLALVGSVGAATNLFSDPEAVNSSAWTKYYLWRFINDTTLAPDGNTTADTFNASAGTDNHYLYQGTSFTSGLPYTWSGHFKQYGTNDKIQLTFSLSRFGSVQYATFNVSDCSVSESASVTAYNETTANGFCRVGITATATSTGTGNGFVIFTGGNTGRAPSYNGTVNPSEAVAAWGMLMEQGSSMSDYFYSAPTGDSIEVTSPNGGESWQRGTAHSITWNYNGTVGSTVNITLMKAGAELDTIIASTSVGTGGSGSYSWSIYGTGTTGSDYSVQVKSTTNASINDVSNSYFTVAAAGVPAGGTNRTWSGTYDFYPADNIINVNISTLPVHSKSSAWITNLTQLAARNALPAVTSHSQPWTTETFWVADSSIPLQRIVSGTDTWNDHDNVAPGVPIPSDMFYNGQAGDAPATILDFEHTTAYSLMHLSKSGSTWSGQVSVWNWSTNNKRFTNSTSGVPWFNNNWVDMNGDPHFYVRGNDGTTNRTATTQVWAGRCMIDVPQWAMIPTYDEVAADDVDHALYLIVPFAGNASSTLWPASNTGDGGERINCIAPGARLRLKASYDISAFSAQPKALLKGAKYWGGIVGDNGASYGIQFYVTNDTRWSNSQLDELKNVPLSAWEVVDESSLMENRYTMDSVGSAPTPSFYMNGTATTPTYGVATDNKYDGKTIGGNYNGASDYPYYSAGIDAVPEGGATYLGTTVTTKGELQYALEHASAGDVVYVDPLANIDMGNDFTTTIPAGVTLASNRHGTTNSTDGGRIFTTAIGTTYWERPMLTTAGEGVRITGLQLSGESYAEAYDPPNNDEGLIYRVGVKVYDANTTIDNCDIKGFGYANIKTIDIPYAGRTVIKYNYIHESQYQHEAYGVEVGGGYADIYANVFYKNRHDITGTGATTEGYVVHDNRFLDTGTWGQNVVGASHIDAHGTGSAEAYSGIRYDIYQNSWEGGHIPAIHQRGYPSDGMYIYYNKILTDGQYDGVTGNLPIYQTYVATPGYGHVYVTYNQYKGVAYNGGQGLLAYQSKATPSSWILSTDAGVPFGGGVPSGVEPVNATFTDTSTGTPTSWAWTRTNIISSSTPQTFSTSQNPGVISFYAGNWSIRLTATNAYGPSTTTANTSFINVTGTTSAPVANFTADNVTPSVGQSVTFTDLSTGSPTSWMWVMKQGSTTNYYYTKNVTRTFDITGTVNVNLTATNSAGSNTMAKTSYITVNDLITPPVADFTPKGTLVTPPLDPFNPYYLSTFSNGSVVQFVDTSTGGSGTAWNWSFQKIDGTWLFNTSQNPSVVFDVNTFGTGERVIIFNVSNTVGYSRITNTRFQVSPPPVIPIAQYYVENSVGTTLLVRSGTTDALSAGAGTQIKFTDASINEPTSVMWTVDYTNETTSTSYTSPFNVTVPSWMMVGGHLRVYFNATNELGTDSIWQDAIVVADTSAPASVTGIANQTGVDTIVWNWTQASDVDHIMVWNNNAFVGNVTGNGTTWTGLTPVTLYEIATKTVDASGNVNTTFSNASTTTLAAMWNFTTPGCTNWVVPAGISSVTLKITGAGSSGRGGQSALYPGGGGKAGQNAIYVNVLVTPGDTHPICVGTGGQNSSYNDVGYAGTESSALGHTMAGGAVPDILYTGTTGGNGENGVFSTTRFALNGTNSSGNVAGTSGVGYGAGGGGGSHDAENPYTTQGGYGANGYVQIIASTFTTSNTPDFVADKTSSDPGSLIHFDDMSTIIDTSGLTYNWSFGDETYSNTSGSSQHVYPYTGSYDVSLTLTTLNGSVTETKLSYISIINRPSYPYIPSQVRFKLIDTNGFPLSGVTISATPANSTIPANWTETLFRIDPSVNIQGTSVVGVTGTDGSWVAPMVPSFLYNISMIRASDINYNVQIYPSQTEYLFTIPLGVIAIETITPGVVSYAVSNAAINSSYKYFNMTYSDTSVQGTDKLSFFVYNLSGKLVSAQNYTGTSANSQTFSQVIPVSQGQTYTYGFVANQSAYGWINQTDTVTLANQIALIGDAPSWVEEFAAIAIILIFGALFSIYSKPFAMIALPLLTWFFQYYMGWLPSNFMSAIALGVMLTLGVAIYIRQKESTIS